MWGFARVDFNREAGNDANNEGNAAGADVRERYLEWHRNFVELDSPRQVNNGTDVTCAFRDVNACGSQGKTVLMYACEKGNLYITQALIDANANVNAKDNDGKTPLMYACERDDLDIVRALIDANANVNAKDKNKETALMYAKGKGNLEIVQALIDAKANVNTKNKK